MSSIPNALTPLLGLIGLLTWVFRKRRRLAGWSRAPGVVIALWRPGKVPAPVVRFHSADGRELTHRSNTGSNVPGFKVGEAVVVLYDPADPSRAVVSSFSQLWAAECIVALMLVVGSVFLILSWLDILR